MGRFTPEWTTDLDITWEQFRAVYPTVVNLRMSVSGTGGFSAEFGEDFFGTLYRQSFTFWNRPVAFEFFTGGLSVEGKLLGETPGRISLSLRMITWLRINYVKVFLWSFLLAAFAAFIVQRSVLAVFGWSVLKYAGRLLIDFFILFLLPAWRWMTKKVDQSIRKKQELYNSVLHEIERRAKTALPAKT